MSKIEVCKKTLNGPLNFILLVTSFNGKCEPTFTSLPNILNTCISKKTGFTCFYLLANEIKEKLSFIKLKMKKQHKKILVTSQLYKNVRICVPLLSSLPFIFRQKMTTNLLSNKKLL